MRQCDFKLGLSTPKRNHFHVLSPTTLTTVPIINVLVSWRSQRRRPVRRRVVEQLSLSLCEGVSKTGEGSTWSKLLRIARVVKRFWYSYPWRTLGWRRKEGGLEARKNLLRPAFSLRNSFPVLSRFPSCYFVSNDHFSWWQYTCVLFLYTLCPNTTEFPLRKLSNDLKIFRINSKWKYKLDFWRECTMYNWIRTVTTQLTVESEIHEPRREWKM